MGGIAGRFGCIPICARSAAAYFFEISPRPDLHGIGIADECRAIGVSALHRLGNDVQRLLAAELCQIVAFENLSISIRCTPPEEGGGIE